MSGDEYAVLVLVAEQHDSFIAADGVRIWDSELGPEAFEVAALAAGLTYDKNYEARLERYIAATPTETIQRVGRTKIVAELMRAYTQGTVELRNQGQVVQRRRVWTATLTMPSLEREFGFAPAGSIEPPSLFVAQTLNAVAADGWTVHHVAEDRAMEGDEVKLVAVRYLLRRAR